MLWAARLQAIDKMGIPEDGIPLYEADLYANQFLVIAHGLPGAVAKARDLLKPTYVFTGVHHSPRDSV